MSCYLIVTAKITDLDGLAKYSKAVGPSLAGINFKVLVATPFGPQWYPYLMRRLGERPANMLFVARNLVRR